MTLSSFYLQYFLGKLKCLSLSFPYVPLIFVDGARKYTMRIKPDVFVNVKTEWLTCQRNQEQWIASLDRKVMSGYMCEILLGPGGAKMTKTCPILRSWCWGENHIHKTIIACVMTANTLTVRGKHSESGNKYGVWASESPLRARVRHWTWPPLGPALS